MIGILSLLWVYYLRYHVMLKDEYTDEKQKEKELLAMSQNIQPSIPWRDILNKPSFWYFFHYIFKKF